ncbi:adenylosuccinate synthase [Capillibacterium thermochitinicola]|uniref:Adenylosuccinate synthetase n=1 Tax=Capillibacterium thermochitinicola TaxID=2699427 RepID=A0A8J6HZB6_9FIRM|nr:adenylosuccinate synthase [Capillibacterium thermochitinicola]MBA2132128.1 adenylosuccinate synthase [Capillibacterium thermochitinicola]
MSITAIVGVNWGDEGKGRIVDYLAGEYQIVVRYQGGNNAGHTVINEYGKFALNLLPSGIFHPGTLNILGTGTVIDLEHLVKEIEGVRAKGVRVDADNLKISDRAIICFPFHQAQDRLEEERLGSKKYGSTVRGIAPVYGDKYLKKGIQIGELFHPAYLKERLATVLEWKNAELTKVYGGRGYQLEEILAWLAEYGEKLKPMVTDTTTLLRQAVKAGKKILLEAQLGALRDIHYGIYPFTTSSSPLAAFAPVGAGVFNRPVERIIGVVKAYSTCVGEGPFVTELFDEVGDRLRQIGAEYGAATGRPRRIGYLDLVATKYGAELQGATELALTKLDVLSSEKKLKVCVGYEIDGEVVTTFPLTPLLYKAKPVYVELDGWEEDISAVRSYSQLPANARRYIQYIEEWLEVPVKYISVGAKREEIIVR